MGIMQVSDETLRNAKIDVELLRADVIAGANIDHTEWGSAEKFRKWEKMRTLLKYLQAGVVAVEKNEYSWATWERERYDPHCDLYDRDGKLVWVDGKCEARGDDYDALVEIGPKYGLIVIEDNGLI